MTVRRDRRTLRQTSTLRMRIRRHGDSVLAAELRRYADQHDLVYSDEATRATDRCLRGLDRRAGHSRCCGPL